MSPRAKNPLRRHPKSHPYSPAVRSSEGRIAIVTDTGRDAVDVGGASDEGAACGRRSRVVLMPRHWRQLAEQFAGDGDKKARSPGRARRKPLKPLRAGMPGVSGVTVVTNARVFYHTRAAAGARAPGIPHALMGEGPCKTRAQCAARTRRRVCSARDCERGEEIHLATTREWIASSLRLAMTADTCCLKIQWVTRRPCERRDP